jgi:FixJ family two-component response regulator
VTAPGGSVVFVVDDDATMRRALSRLLQSEGFRVEAFPSAKAFIARAPFPNPACLILDLCMPDMDGMRVQEELARDHSGLPVIFLTAHAEVPASVRAIQRGASDFLTKPVDEKVLVEAVHAALEKCSAEAEERARVADARRRVASLTRRERQVLDAVIGGALNKQAALRLGITEATVKVHRGHAMQKLGVSSVADLVRLCEKAGIRPAPPEPPATTKV